MEIMNVLKVVIVSGNNMKKSQLRNIIRESVKELITEQSSNLASQCVELTAMKCPGSSLPGNTQMVLQCPHLDGNWPSASDIGRVFINITDPGSNSPLPSQKTPYIITDTHPIYQPNQPLPFIPSITHELVTVTGCNTYGSGAWLPTCNSSAWSNYSNWVSFWTSNNVFNSTNPNQPCNHICQQIDHWTYNAMLSGPIQQNVLACKIDEGNNQSNIHGCNC